MSLTAQQFREAIKNSTFDYRSVKPHEREALEPYIGKTQTDDDTCPACGKEIEDIWEFSLNNETAEGECPHCDAKIEVVRNISISYTVTRV